MGANAIAFIKALGLAKVDVLGFSIDGMVAQEIALQAPDLVRRLILVGTGLRGGDQPKDFSQLTQPHTTLSTSSAISFRQGPTESFARRR